VVYDLGSGDGRIVLGTARQYGCRAVGYEINSRLVEQSRESVRAQDLGHLVRIEHAELTYFPLPFCALRTDAQHLMGLGLFCRAGWSPARYLFWAGVVWAFPYGMARLIQTFGPSMVLSA
jgi:hypothetical protein